MKHGTTSGYKTHGCRCRACTDAVVAYQRAYKQHVRGCGPIMVDAAEARTHISALVESGVSVRAISRSTGLSLAHVRDIQHGRLRKLWPSTANPILGIGLHTDEGAGRIDGRRVRLLIDALAKAGVTQRDIARHMRYRNDQNLALARRKYVMRRSFDRIVVIYRHYAGQGRVPASLLDEVDI